MDQQDLDAAHRAHDSHFAYFRSLHEARILDARAAIQAALLINGGAATAVLAFAGSLATRTTQPHVPRLFAWGLGCFASGVACGAAAALFAYLANHGYAEALGATQLSNSYPFKQAKPEAEVHQRKAESMHQIATWCGAGALLAFIAGAVCAAVGLVTIK